MKSQPRTFKDLDETLDKSLTALKKLGPGRPKGTTKPDSERRVSLTIKLLPYVAENIKKLPRGHLRKQLENLYG